MKATANREKFYEAIATHPGIVLEQQALDAAKINQVRAQEGYSQPRAFSQPITQENLKWLQDNLANPDPLILDITAGGGSIPFEAGRLGISTIANELNPVAGLILWATCEWPQKYGYKLLQQYEEVANSFLKKVNALTTELYPDEPQPQFKEPEQSGGKRQVQTHLFARIVTCPSCEGTIPLSPNWRLDSNGTGIRIIPDVDSGTCSFEVVNKVSEHSTGTVSRAKATCPYPNCGVTTPAGYIPSEAKQEGWATNSTA